jgi:superfamily II DNA or RNA helicase
VGPLPSPGVLRNRKNRPADRPDSNTGRADSGHFSARTPVFLEVLPWRAVCVKTPVEIFFDRGSIVLEGVGPPARGGVPDVPRGFVWDARVQRWRAEAYRLPAVADWLRRRGMAWERRSERPAGFSPRPVPSESLPELRPYQADALEAWAAAGRRGLVSLPTGSGKTRLAIRAMLGVGAPSLVAVPTRQLLRQWAGALREVYPGAIGIHGDGEHDLQPITVATFESAYLRLDGIGDHFDLLVVDEAHHLASERLAGIARMTTAPFRLGLSGTLPGEGPDRRRLEDVLGPACFALPLSRLSGDGLLHDPAPVATFEVRLVTLRLTREEQAAYNRARTEFLLHYRPFLQHQPEGEWVDFVRAASRSPGGRAALAALRASKEIVGLARAKLAAVDQLLDLHSGEPSLVFTADNAAAYEVSRRFLIPAITCEVERAEREVILDRFRRGIYRALVSARVLNEGIDVPDASVAIVAGGSSSRVEHAQRIGRVLRPAPGKKAIVYELVVAGTSEWTVSDRRNRRGALNPSPSL